MKFAIKHIMKNPLHKDRFLNINFPPCSTIKGIKLTHHGRSFWLESLTKEDKTDTHSHFHLNEVNNNIKEHPDSDIALLKKGFITAVPIDIGQLTDTSHIEKNKDIFNTLF